LLWHFRHCLLQDRAEAPPRVEKQLGHRIGGSGADGLDELVARVQEKIAELLATRLRKLGSECLNDVREEGVPLAPVRRHAQGQAELGESGVIERRPRLRPEAARQEEDQEDDTTKPGHTLERST